MRKLIAVINMTLDGFCDHMAMISIVFSHMLKNVEWQNTQLKKEVIKEEVLELKQQAGKNILVGSPSLI